MDLISNCELCAFWTKNDEEPQILMHFMDMQGVDMENFQITLIPNRPTLSKSSNFTINYNRL